MSEEKEYIVSLSVSFDTPLGVMAHNDSGAEKKAKAKFREAFREFKKSLDDIANLEIEVEYTERADGDEEDED